MKKIRIFLPALAIMVGVVGAFATTSKAKTVDDDPIILSFQVMPCKIDGVCNPGGTVSCASSAGKTTVYDEENDCNPVNQDGTYSPAN